MPKRHRRQGSARHANKRPGSRLRLRPLSRQEISTLRRWSVDSHPPRRRRARAILMALEAHTLREIARALAVHTRTVQHWLHRFNQEGAASLQPRKPTGRPSRWTPEIAARVRAIFEQPPTRFGYDRPSWSLRLLAAYLHREGITPTASAETLRTWLRRIFGAPTPPAPQPPAGTRHRD